MTNKPPVALAWGRPGQPGPRRAGKRKGGSLHTPLGGRLSHASEPQALRTWICQPEPSLALQRLIDLNLFYVSI